MIFKPKPTVFFLSLILFLLFSNIAFTQNITLDIQGECKYYNVTLTAQGFEEACYDVKIDITTTAGRVGEIYDEREGWKSSFFYINEILCTEANTTTKEFQLRTDSNNKLNFIAKLRLDEKVWESSYYEVQQDCPEPEDDTLFVFAVALIVILVLLVLVTWYVKGFETKTKEKQ